MIVAGGRQRPGLLTAVARALLGKAWLVVLAGAWGGACATSETQGSAQGRAAAPAGMTTAGAPAIGRPAPDLTVERLDGKKLALASLRGKVVLLDVWASWCVPCLKELPILDDIARRLGGKGVEVVAVSIDQERDNVVKFLESRPRWALTIAHDPQGVIADKLQPAKMPTSYAIDRSGIIRYINEGFEPVDAPLIEKKLTELAGR